MPRGGARPGAGRPPKPRPPLAVGLEAVTPERFLRSVMEDELQDLALRIGAAKALLVHQRATAPSKRQHAEEAAATADHGTDWERLLAAPSAADDKPTDWDGLLAG